MNRRSFLQATLLAGLSLNLRKLQHPSASPKFAPSKYDTEAARLNAALMDHFWDKDASLFRAPVKSAETVDSTGNHDNGYTFWPSLLGAHALIEGERNHPSTYASQIWHIYSKGLEQYWNSSLHAYNAWLYFPNNADSYYDDNSWAVITLVEAHNATIKSDPAHAAVYLKRAAEIMQHYVYDGWDNTGKPGGVKWGTDKSKSGTGDKGTSSTAGAALAALTLAKTGVNASFNTNWGGNVLQWLMANLLGSNGLIQDALVYPDWRKRAIYWTYNTGVPIRAFVEHYRLTKSADSLNQATALAQAAMDRKKRPLYDGLVKNSSVNYWYDTVFFVQYLVDGLLQLAEVTANSTIAARLKSEATQNAQFVLDHLKDSDGFYWRNMRLYMIGEAQLKSWESITGQVTTLSIDSAERSMESAYTNIDVAQRPLVKTLLANATAARLFWLMSRI